MKRNLLITYCLVIVLIMSGAANAELVFYEGFDYPVKDLHGKGVWINTDGSAKVVSPGMTYPGLSTTGNCIDYSPVDQESPRATIGAIKIVPAVAKLFNSTSGTIYITALVDKRGGFKIKNPNPPAGGDNEDSICFYKTALGDGSASYIYVTAHEVGTTDEAWRNIGHARKGPNLVAIKIKMNEGPDDIWGILNPDLSQGEPAWKKGQHLKLELTTTTFNMIVATDHTDGAQEDELRIATTWAGAVGLVPERPAMATGPGLAANPKGPSKGGMAIVKSRTAAATIVVPDKPTPTVSTWREFPVVPKWTTQDAATLLQEYIQKVSGAKLPILRESEAPEGNLILVGNTKLARKHGLKAEELPEEGYRLRSFPGGVAIVGEIGSKGIDRGTLFGVYDFLERVAGVRWYFPGEMGTVIPKRDSLSVGNLDVTNSPRFAVRLGGVSHYAAGESHKWHPALRYGIRQGLIANHTAACLLPAGKEHPEYFAITRDGKRALPEKGYRVNPRLCYTEPGVVDEYLKRIDHYFASGGITAWSGASSKPRGNNIPFGPTDGYAICRCPRCQKEIDLLRGQHGSGSNYISGFLSKLATKLKERHPEAVIWSLTYANYLLPPDRVTLSDNVGITLCIIPTSIQMTHPMVWRRNIELIEAWYEALGRRNDRIIIWDYFVYPNGSFVAPTEEPHVLAEFIRYLETRSLGIFNNGFNPRTRTAGPKLYLTYRMVWFMHQLLWDPSADVDRLGEQFCQDLFGPAAPQMIEFYKLLEDRWEKIEWEGIPTDASLTNDAVYGETYPSTVVTSLEVMLETALATAPAQSIYHRRLTWFADEAFRPFFKKARSFHNRK